MNERLLALATAQARTNHLKDSDADGFGCRDGHKDQFKNCPHEDCRMAQGIEFARCADCEANRWCRMVRGAWICLGCLGNEDCDD